LDGQDSGGVVFSGESGKAGSGKPAAGGPGGASGAGGSHWGFSFLLMLCLTTGGYLLGMTAYNMKIGEKAGADALPHPEFWSSLTSLVVDGAAFTKNNFSKAGHAQQADLDESNTDEDLSTPLVANADTGKQDRKSSPPRRQSESQIAATKGPKKKRKKKKPTRKSMPELQPEDGEEDENDGGYE